MPQLPENWDLHPYQAELHQDETLEHHPFAFALPFSLSAPEAPSGSDVCDLASAIDLGAPGNAVAVSSDACVQVDAGFPSWWGTRTMKLQPSSGSHYPLPVTWSDVCAGSSGSGTIQGDWVDFVFGPTSDQCPTLIQLGGDGSDTVDLRYYAQ